MGKQVKERKGGGINGKGGADDAPFWEGGRWGGFGFFFGGGGGGTDERPDTALGSAAGSQSPLGEEEKGGEAEAD